MFLQQRLLSCETVGEKLVMLKRTLKWRSNQRWNTKQPRLLQRLLNESILSTMSLRREILWSDLQFKNFNLQWHISRGLWWSYHLICEPEWWKLRFPTTHKQREGCDLDRSIRVIYSSSIFLSWFCSWRLSCLVNNYNLQCIKLFEIMMMHLT